MRAIVYKGPNEVSVETVADPKIESPTDAIVRITSSGICGQRSSHVRRPHPPTGRIGIVGVYFPEDPGGEIFEKGLSVGTGQTPVKKYNAYLRDLIVAGRAKPSFIVSHRLTLDEAPDAYEKFDERSDGYTKVVLKPQPGAAT